MPRTVLIVDDSPTIRGFARIFLKPLQIEVKEAEDGAQALDFIFCRGAYAGRSITDRPNLILLDLNLPKVDGKELLAAIRETPSKL